MWIYSQSTGILWDEQKLRIGKGYSGKDEGKNNPNMEAVPFKGPIPRGKYLIGNPYNSDSVGRFAMRLTPTCHRAHGRTDFAMHGDSASHPGEASEGCIVMPKYVRIAVHESNDKILEVIE